MEINKQENKEKLEKEVINPIFSNFAERIYTQVNRMKNRYDSTMPKKLLINCAREFIDINTIFVKIPHEQYCTSAKETSFVIPELPSKSTIVHIFFSMKAFVFLIGQLCDNGCKKNLQKQDYNALTRCLYFKTKTVAKRKMLKSKSECN